MYCQNAFENWFGWQRSLGSIKDNPSMAVFQYSNNARYYKPKQFKPIADGNVNGNDSSMIALTHEPLPCWKPKKEWKSSTAASPKLKQNTS